MNSTTVLRRIIIKNSIGNNWCGSSIYIHCTSKCCGFIACKKDIYNGKLFLTSNRLIFKSSKLETREPIFVKYLNSIKNIGLRCNVGMINRSLEITSNFSNDKFVIDYPCDWKNIIENQINHSQDTETLMS